MTLLQIPESVTVNVQPPYLGIDQNNQWKRAEKRRKCITLKALCNLMHNMEMNLLLIKTIEICNICAHGQIIKKLKRDLYVPSFFFNWLVWYCFQLMVWLWCGLHSSAGNGKRGVQIKQGIASYNDTIILLTNLSPDLLGLVTPLGLEHGISEWVIGATIGGPPLGHCYSRSFSPSPLQALSKPCQPVSWLLTFWECVRRI